MNLPADENIPASLVRVLRQDGHDIVEIRTLSPGLSDQGVMQSAHRDNRIILTFDKDFGELAIRDRITPGPGIILLRIPKKNPGWIAEYVHDVIRSRQDRVGHFSLLKKRIRMRPLTTEDIQGTGPVLLFRKKYTPVFPGQRNDEWVRISPAVHAGHNSSSSPGAGPDFSCSGDMPGFSTACTGAGVPICTGYAQPGSRPRCRKIRGYARRHRVPRYKDCGHFLAIWVPAGAALPVQPGISRVKTKKI